MSTIKCPRCDGAGKYQGDLRELDDLTCPVCLGKGRVPKVVEWEEKKPKRGPKLRGGLGGDFPKPGDPWPGEVQPGEIQSRVVQTTYPDGSPRFLVQTRMLPREPGGIVHGTTEEP